MGDVCFCSVSALGLMRQGGKLRKEAVFGAAKWQRRRRQYPMNNHASKVDNLLLGKAVLCAAKWGRRRLSDQ